MFIRFTAIPGLHSKFSYIILENNSIDNILFKKNIHVKRRALGFDLKFQYLRLEIKGLVNLKL